MTQFCLLGLSGSLRRASNSTAVLRGLQDAMAPRAAINIFPLHGIPLYNEDDDAEHAPESVRALRSVIETSDGVIMISPEYNHGMSDRLGLSALWTFGAKGQAGTDDDGLARLHRRRVRAAANERDARLDPCAPCAPAPDRDRRRA
jgi:hypothetical protein